MGATPEQIEHYRQQAREAAADCDGVTLSILQRVSLLCDLSERVAEFRTAFHTGDDSLAEIAAVFAALSAYENAIS